MAEALDDGQQETGAFGDRQARARDAGRYLLALLGYIGLGVLTKGFLSFTYGLLYFVLVLDVLPRTARRLRSRRSNSRRPAAEVVDR
jgi:4-amino-4-deoxy-L-arabinose transferase-like glycosyltransferase